MARKARCIDALGIYYLVQSGDGLFRDDEDRMAFKKILDQSRRVYGYKLYAYCLKEPDQYHLVVYAGGSDLSKIMKSVNIAYAMYRKVQGSLFKDRYKSVLLTEQSDFEDAMLKVKQHYEGDSCFDDAMQCCDFGNPFEMVCDQCLKTEAEAKAYVENRAKALGISMERLLKNKKLRNSVIIELRKITLISLKEMGVIFGGLSESSLSKIIKKEYS
jgi:putative transposase